MKTCRSCHIEKSSDEMRKDPRNRDGLGSYCLKCHNKKYAGKWRNKNPEKAREQDKRCYEKNKDSISKRRVNERLKSRYGVTVEWYDFQFDFQDGACAICRQCPKKGKRLVVDHDHKTGKVRGLLCHSCNLKLGVIDNTDWVSVAKMYLLSPPIQEM